MKSKSTFRQIFIAVLPVLFFVSHLALAQNAQVKDALALEFVNKTLKPDEKFRAAMAQVAEKEINRIKSSGMTQKQKGNSLNIVSVTNQEVAKFFRIADFKQDYAKIYSENFSEADLRSIIVFFDSPTGQKWVARAPEVQSAIMNMQQHFLVQLTEAIEKAKIAVRKRLAEQGAAASP